MLRNLLSHKIHTFSLQFPPLGILFYRFSRFRFQEPVKQNSSTRPLRLTQIVLHLPLPRYMSQYKMEEVLVLFFLSVTPKVLSHFPKSLVTSSYQLNGSFLIQDVLACVDYRVNPIVIGCQKPIFLHIAMYYPKTASGHFCYISLNNPVKQDYLEK